MEVKTIYFKGNILTELEPYMEDNEKLSPFINRVLKEYVEDKKLKRDTEDYELKVLFRVIKRLLQLHKEDKLHVLPIPYKKLLSTRKGSNEEEVTIL